MATSICSLDGTAAVVRLSRLPVTSRGSPHEAWRPDLPGVGDTGSRGAHDDEALHVDRGGVEGLQRRHGEGLLGPADVATHDDDGVARPLLEEDLARTRDLLGSAARGGVVERYDEVGGGRGPQAALDDVPRLEP